MKLKVVYGLIVLSFLSQQLIYAAPGVRLRGAASRVTAISRVHLMRQMSSTPLRVKPAVAPQRKKLLNPFLIGTAAGLAALYFMDRPEDFRGTSVERELRSAEHLDRSSCSEDDRSVLDWRKLVESAGIPSALRYISAHSERSESESRVEREKIEKIKSEIPRFFETKNLRETPYDEFKEYFNGIESEEASDSVSHLEAVKKATGLSESEVLSVYMYTLDSGGLNAKMRRGVSGDEYPATMSASIDSALRSLAAKNPIPSGVPLYRGTDLPKAVFDRMRSEGRFSDSAFLSTSTAAETSSGFVKSGDPMSESVFFVIEGAKSGASIQKLSSYEQDEVLFPARTKFRVKSMTRDDKKGHWEIHLEEED